MTLCTQGFFSSWDTLFFNLIVVFAAVKKKLSGIYIKQILISHLLFMSADTRLLWLSSACSSTLTTRAATIWDLVFW